MDLESFATRSKAEEGAPMEVRNPVTQEPLLQDDGQPVTITLAGSDSDRFQRVQRHNLNRRLKNSGRRGNVTLTAEELDAEKIETLVACTISWSGIQRRGAPIDCTPDNARSVYKDFPWVREQADEFVNDRVNFLKASSTT
jgi:hypothetical protein